MDVKITDRKTLDIKVFHKWDILGIIHNMLMYSFFMLLTIFSY